MNAGAALRRRIDHGPPLVLDGPTGTELERRGLDTRGPLWSSAAIETSPGSVRAVHRDYVQAGAEILTTATFRAHRRDFVRAGRGERDWKRTIDAAVALAAEARNEADRPVWIAGSMAPVGDCYAPEDVPEDGLLRAEHEAMATQLATSGADVLLVETMNLVREGRIAAASARATGLPVLLSWLAIPGGRLLSGEPLETALRATRAEADVFLVNCCSLEAVADAIPLLQGSGRPWGAYANGSRAHPRTGWTAGDDVGVAAYRDAARRWHGAGARILGSCCGTGPAFTAAIAGFVRTASRTV